MKINKLKSMLVASLIICTLVTSTTQIQATYKMVETACDKCNITLCDYCDNIPVGRDILPPEVDKN